MSKGKWFLLAVAVVVALVAFRGSPERDAQEACVSAIEATNNEAGLRTDYTGAYAQCRR